MIVVTVPTGQIGRHVVRDLLTLGAPLRLIARDASKLPDDLRRRVEVVEGSHGDEAVVNSAFKGARALFWIVPPNPQRTLEQAYLDFSRPAAAAVEREGVPRVVAITALGRGTEWQDKAGLVSASIRMDDLMMATGAAFRGLAMPSFMENLLRQIPSIKEKGMLFGPLDGGTKQPTTATRDMGAAAARLLADERWTGQEEVPLLGPDDLSFDEMAVVVSQELGRTVRYEQVPFDAFKAQLLGRGMGESFAQGYIDMMRAKNEGMDNVAARGAQNRAPTSFRAFCRDVLKPAASG